MKEISITKLGKNKDIGDWGIKLFQDKLNTQLRIKIFSFVTSDWNFLQATKIKETYYQTWNSFLWKLHIFLTAFIYWRLQLSLETINYSTCSGKTLTRKHVFGPNFKPLSETYLSLNIPEIILGLQNQLQLKSHGFRVRLKIPALRCFNSYLVERSIKTRRRRSTSPLSHPSSLRF